MELKNKQADVFRTFMFFAAKKENNFYEAAKCFFRLSFTKSSERGRCEVPKSFKSFNYLESKTKDSPS